MPKFTKEQLCIIGVSGTNGSGKDTVGHLLAEKHGYLFISVTDILRAELERRGLEITRQNLRILSAEWRRELGLGVLIDKAVADWQTKKADYNGVVIASLRNHGEADRVHDLGGIVIWIDADPKTRYDRIQKANDRGDREGEDHKTYEQFLDEQAVEMQPSGDEATLDMAAVKERSDICIDNTNQDLETYKQAVAKALGL